jgi:RHH-type transcriptional regulator, proline utilization regulon repressor / proline dehydrogenase / delta 1-pyrroline-5-carboxylate dehydrogenase
MGLHSRIARTAETVERAAHVGNLYVNRSMIGAVVGSQPFGGEGLSGTGPKAGGPHYLHRFCVERTTSVDTTSAGGNASLLSLGE